MNAHLMLSVTVSFLIVYAREGAATALPVTTGPKTGQPASDVSSLSQPILKYVTKCEKLKGTIM